MSDARRRELERLVVAGDAELGEQLRRERCRAGEHDWGDWWARGVDSWWVDGDQVRVAMRRAGEPFAVRACPCGARDERPLPLHPPVEARRSFVIVDDPTRGLDEGDRQALWAWFDQLSTRILPTRES